jgi:hypothetical protein
MLTDATHALMTLREFEDLLDYSCSLPTGTTPGKRWKRSDVYAVYARGGVGPLHWRMGEYGTDIQADPRGDRFGKTIDIIWRSILIDAGG